MPDQVPISANEFIEQRLNELLEGLEQDFDCDALCVVSPIAPGVDDSIRIMIEDMRQRKAARSRLAVILTTNGGYIEVVQRIVDTFRHHYDHVSFIIPNYAFSAGTVLAMSGDDIFMDYFSRLGPIDPQIETAQGRWVPALGYLKKWEALLEKATNGELTNAEAQLMIYGFDQAELYHYEQARELSITLLKEWLVRYKFKNWVETETRKRRVTSKMRQTRAEEIARQLNDTDKWHSHGNGISMAVLRSDLNLLIDDLDGDAKRNECLKQYDGLLTDYIQKIGFQAMLHTVGRYLPLL